MRASIAICLFSSLVAAGACDEPTGDGDGDGDGDADADADGDSDGDGDGDEAPPDVCPRPVDLVEASAPDRVVGGGTPAGCTEAALAEALAAGGVIGFDCGPGEVTIAIADGLRVTRDVVVDGGGRVTLDGGGAARIFTMDTGNFEATSPHLVLQRLVLTGGRATGTEGPLGTDVDGGGGAVFFRGGSVTAVDCVFRDNRAAEWGPDVAGGAVFGTGRGALVAVGCVFAGNRAANGGAVGALAVGVTLVNCRLAGNEATGEGANWVDEHGEQQGHGGNGGAISMDGRGQALELCGCVVADNRAGAFGGAVFRTSYESEPTRIDRSTFAGNAVPLPDDPEHGSGAGGLYLQGTHVTMTASTVSNNAARAFAGLWILGHGAAQGVADLTNVTLADNFTWPVEPFTERGIGGGLTIGDNVVGTLLNCTIAGNAAQFASGVARVSPLVVRNTIIANHADNEWTPLNCTGAAYASPPAAGADNIQWPVGRQDDMDCTAGIVRADPLLAALGDHGGPTATMAPLDGSPALGAGHDCPATDQRGEPRGEPCAVGAVEP